MFRIFLVAIVGFAIGAPLGAQGDAGDEKRDHDRPERERGRDGERREHDKKRPERDKRDKREDGKERDGERRDHGEVDHKEMKVKVERIFAEMAGDDKKISKEEFKGREAAFEKLDSDSDGFLTLREVLRASRLFLEAVKGDEQDKRPAEFFEKNDKNKDGKISKREFSGTDEVFDKLDLDGDGFLSKEEVREHFVEKPDERKRKAAEEALKRLKDKFKRFDKNDDHGVDKDEFPGSDKLFGEIDTSGDGKITFDEMAAYMKDHHGKHSDRRGHGKDERRGDEHHGHERKHKRDGDGEKDRPHPDREDDE